MCLGGLRRAEMLAKKVLLRNGYSHLVVALVSAGA